MNSISVTAGGVVTSIDELVIKVVSIVSTSKQSATALHLIFDYNAQTEEVLLFKIGDEIVVEGQITGVSDSGELRISVKKLSSAKK